MAMVIPRRARWPRRRQEASSEHSAARARARSRRGTARDGRPGLANPRARPRLRCGERGPAIHPRHRSRRPRGRTHLRVLPPAFSLHPGGLGTPGHLARRLRGDVSSPGPARLVRGGPLLDGREHHGRGGLHGGREEADATAPGRRGRHPRLETEKYASFTNRVGRRSVEGGAGGFPPRTHIFCALPERATEVSWPDTSGGAGCESVWSGEGTPSSARYLA